MDEEVSIRLSRRQVIALGAAAVGVTALAYAVVRQVGTYPEPEEEFVNLSPKEIAVYRLIGDFMLPPGGPLPGSGGDTETLRRIDAFLGRLPPHHMRVVSALPHVFEHGPALDRFGARSLTQLSDERQRETLHRWVDAQGAIEAQLWAAMKVVYSVTYFERGDVLQAMGMGPFCPVAR